MVCHFYANTGRFSGCLILVREGESGWGQVTGRGALMRQRHQDIHIVDWEEARLAVDHAFVPVVVDLIGQGDDVALLEA